MTATRTVSPYQTEDGDALTDIHNRAFPTKQIGPFFLSLQLDSYMQRGNWVWTVREGAQLVGYAYITPVPGLDGVYDLQGCIDPQKQRQGFGRFLLQQMITDLKQHGRFELSHPVPTLNTPTAQFLTSQGFFIEHTEQQLILNNPSTIKASLPSDFKLVTFDQETAVPQFMTTYDTIFKDLPWYQPYTEEWEVVMELSNPELLLFLQHNGAIAGLAWLRNQGRGLGEIEPFGLIPAYQGQGLGRQFLSAAIQRLVNTKQVTKVRIGAWQSNDRAIHLYRKLGFQPHKSQIYLAYRHPTAG